MDKPIYFYVANLWSEIEKIFIWKEKGDEIAMKSAFDRAIPIINKIQSMNNASASFEMAILKDVLIDIKNSMEKHSVSREQIASFLSPFALRVVNEMKVK